MNAPAERPAAGGLVALVTGASSGIGKAIAQRLAADGLTVVAAARNREAMADLEALGVTVVELDLSREESIVAAITAIEARHGPVQVLVNNAGFGLFGPIETVPLDAARRQFEVNLFGLARLTQAVLPGMRSAGRGKIVNISSTNGRVYAALSGWYTASKHALEGWSDCLRLEVEPFGIDVVIIEPGVIRTRFGETAASGLRAAAASGPYAERIEKMEAVRRRAPAGSEPEVVAEAVAQAIRAKRPRIRHAVGFAAAPMIWLRRHLSDRMFDRIARAAG